MIIETASYAFVAIDGGGYGPGLEPPGGDRPSDGRAPEAIGVELPQLIVARGAAVQRTATDCADTPRRARVRILLATDGAAMPIHRDGHQFPVELTDLGRREGGGKVAFQRT